MMNQDLQAKLVDPKAAAQTLLQGGVGIIPTDTLYGLAARAADPAAVSRLYALKNRDHKPGTIIAATTDQLIELGVDSAHITRIQAVWPGPVSVETPLDESLAYLHQDTGRQGFRVVDNEELRELLLQTGPLLTSSANQPGEPVATTIDQAWGYFVGSVDFYVDGGNLADRLPSTLIAVMPGGAVQVIREGAVRAADLTPLQ